MKKATIYDVAAAAGVSVGTVDRVLHGRGRVSQDTVSKVNAAVQTLGYRPNMYAASLASRRERRIAVVIPMYTKGSYWELIHNGFDKIAAEVSSLGINVECLFYNDNSPESFSEVCSSIIQNLPDGVVIRPLFDELASEFLHSLREKGVPYVFVDKPMADDGYLAYYGVDFHKSGYLAGNLLTLDADVKDVLLVRLKRDAGGLSDPTRLRREGLLEYLKCHFPTCRIHSVTIPPYDEEDRNSALSDFFSSHPEVKYAAVTSSRAYLFADFLRDNPVEISRCVGFDDIPANRDALHDGSLSFLVTRHIEEQAELSVSALVAFLLRGESPAKKDNYMHMDILTRYNLDS